MERSTPEAGAHLHERRRGEAQRRQGWVGGVYPSAPIKARTAVSDGQRASTRAARSAGLRFAVRSLSEALDRENTLREGERVCRSPHPPRSGPPSPRGEGQERTLKWVRLQMSDATLPILGLIAPELTTLRERERDCSSPHPPLTWSPFPLICTHFFGHFYFSPKGVFLSWMLP